MLAALIYKKYKNVVFLHFRAKKLMHLLIFIFLCVISIVLTSEGNCAQVTFSWDKNAESNVAGYKIYYGSSSRSYNWFIDVGNVTSYTITGLSDGSTYYFAATAYDKSKKESKYSSEISFNSCNFTISPATVKFDQRGGTGAIQVSTQTNCSWTANSSASWVAITSGSKGTGSGKVSYSVTNNSKSSPRTVSFTVARNIFTVNQTGDNQISDESSIKGYMVKVIKKQVNAGSGTIKSYDRKIDCGGACFSSYKENSTVNLYATPEQGSTFVGWAPASLGCEGTGPCRIAVDRIKSIKAIFVGNYELKLVNISKNGGAGRVTSSPWSLDCKADNTGKCEGAYRYDRDVTLSASPSYGSTFVGWRPANLCPGTGKCVVTMDRKRTVKAVFAKQSDD